MKRHQKKTTKQTKQKQKITTTKTKTRAKQKRKFTYCAPPKIITTEGSTTEWTEV